MKLTRAAETQITSDWQQQLPSMGVYKPRWLLRRVGPLLLGIILERDSVGDVYKPTFHVHFLGRAHEGVVLMLASQMRNERSGGPSFVDLRWHNENYREAADRMARQAPLALAGDLQVDQVLNVYQLFLATPLGQRMKAHLYADMILLSAWAGRASTARTLFDEALKTMTNAREYQHVGGRAQFESDMRSAIDQPDTIRATIQGQIEALGVADLPESSLHT
jgi:hypothetical protein